MSNPPSKFAKWDDVIATFTGHVHHYVAHGGGENALVGLRAEGAVTLQYAGRVVYELFQNALDRARTRAVAKDARTTGSTSRGSYDRDALGDSAYVSSPNVTSPRHSGSGVRRDTIARVSVHRRERGAPAGSRLEPDRAAHAQQSAERAHLPRASTCVER